MPNMKRNDNIEKIKLLFDKQQWRKAKGLIVKELANQPKNLSLLSRLVRVYYELGDFKSAVRTGHKTYRLAPAHPVIIWDYAYALFLAGKFDESRILFHKLLKRADGNLKNACRFMIGRCYLNLMKLRYSKRWIESYLTNIAVDGQPYSRRYPNDMLREIRIVLNEKSRVPVLWQALIEIKANSLKAGVKRAFISGVVPARNINEAKQKFIKELDSQGYEVKGIAEFVTFRLNVLASAVTPDLQKAANYASSTGNACFGTMYCW